MFVEFICFGPYTNSPRPLQQTPQPLRSILLSEHPIHLDLRPAQEAIVILSLGLFPNRVPRGPTQEGVPPNGGGDPRASRELHLRCVLAKVAHYSSW